MHHRPPPPHPDRRPGGPPHVPPPQPAGRKPYDLKRTMGRIAWLSAIVVLSLGVLAFVTGRGFSLSAGEGGPKVEVDAPLAGQASQDQISDSQGDLTDELEQASDAIADDTSIADVDISGSWFGLSSGGTYVIEQVGNAATITEVDGFGNITAVGQGTLAGAVFDFEYVSAAGTSGVGRLQLNSAGALEGFWEDPVFGSRAALLSR